MDGELQWVVNGSRVWNSVAPRVAGTVHLVIYVIEKSRFNIAFIGHIKILPHFKTGDGYSMGYNIAEPFLPIFLMLHVKNWYFYLMNRLMIIVRAPALRLCQNSNLNYRKETR